MALRFIRTTSDVMWGSGLDEIHAHATEILLSTMARLTDLAKPKDFQFSSSTLRRLERIPHNDESNYAVRVVKPKLQPVDEIVDWQITGYVNVDGKRRVLNVVTHSVFHTYDGDRSGSYERFINGKDFYALTLEDAWQDNNKWQEYASQLKQAS